MKCSLFHEQNDLKISKKKINTDISNEFVKRGLSTHNNREKKFFFALSLVSCISIGEDLEVL